MNSSRMKFLNNKYFNSTRSNLYFYKLLDNDSYILTQLDLIYIFYKFYDLAHV